MISRKLTEPCNFHITLFYMTVRYQPRRGPYYLPECLSYVQPSLSRPLASNQSVTLTLALIALWQVEVFRALPPFLGNSLKTKTRGR